jgi:hypothetical protein
MKIYNIVKFETSDQSPSVEILFSTTSKEKATKKFKEKIEETIINLIAYNEDNEPEGEDECYVWEENGSWLYNEENNKFFFYQSEDAFYNNLQLEIIESELTE